MPPPDQLIEQALIVGEPEFLWQRAEGEVTRLFSIVPSAKRAATRPREVGDHHPPPPRIVAVGEHVEQLEDLDLEPGLLTHLAQRGHHRLLVDLDVTGGQRPVPLIRRDATPHQQHLAECATTAADDRRHRPHRGMDPDHMGAARAGAALAALDQTITERRAAARAELLGRVMKHGQFARIPRSSDPVGRGDLRAAPVCDYHPAAMKRVHLLGSTGSIGRTAERVLAELVATHRVVGLASGRGGPELRTQIERWKPDAVAIADEAAAEQLTHELRGRPVRVFGGPDAAKQLVAEVAADVVLNGISGARGLDASFAALHAGADLALANKESMVMAGPLLARAAEQSGARILPVDSEHSAIFQCLHREPPRSIRRVILTASGGPFRTTPADELAQVTPAQALRHPTWNMGAKITIDSATLMNKALEVVEARWLFGMPAERITVVVHPQSIVHSMVEFCDGSILAQLGVPDMAVPIRFALGYPERTETSASYFDLERFGMLTFEAPDVARFPGLELGFRAAREGGTSGAVLNAANEVAVASFLDGELAFDRIAAVVAAALDHVPHVAAPSLEQLLAADAAARTEATACCC